MTGNRRQPTGEHPGLPEPVLVVLLFLAAGPLALYSSQAYATGLSWWSALPLALTAAVSVLWRHSHPRTVLAVTVVCASAAAGIGYLLTPMLLAPVMVALYALAVRLPRAELLRYFLAATAVIVLTALFGDKFHHPWPLTTVNPILCLTLPIVLGTVAQLRAAYLKAVQDRAEHAERTRDEEAARRVSEERIRIARELHDVVAHHLTLANAQATTGAYLARNGSGEPEQMFTQLATTTSTALRELKATVGLLRQPGDTDSPLEPAPSLRQLPELTTSFTSAGLTVEVTVDGEPQPLSTAVDLTAYRILQEALTNAAKYSTGTAHVRLAYRPDLLTITITNDTAPAAQRTPTPGNGGFGLTGMRERAHAVGGHFHAEPHSGGFTVTTDLPILA